MSDNTLSSYDQEDTKSVSADEESIKEFVNKKEPRRRRTTLNMHDYKAFKMINNIKQRYIFGRILGKGAYGRVRKCKHKDTGKSLAIKIMDKKSIINEEICKELLENELSLLAEKSHPNLIRIIDLLEDKKNYYIVSEQAKGGELFDRLTEVKSFTENEAADIVY